MPCSTCEILARTASQPSTRSSSVSVGALVALGLAVAVPVGLILVAAAKQ